MVSLKGRSLVLPSLKAVQCSLPGCADFWILPSDFTGGRWCRLFPFSGSDLQFLSSRSTDSNRQQGGRGFDLQVRSVCEGRLTMPIQAGAGLFFSSSELATGAEVKSVFSENEMPFGSESE